MSAEYRRSLPVRSTGFPRKASGAVVKILLYAVIILAIAAGLWFGIGRRWFAPTTKAAGIIHVPVVRGTFVHEVNGKGNAESAKNIDITCQVEGSVTVIWIISEGEVVKEGEELVLLDSSNIEDKLNTQQSTYSTSLANVASAQATLQTAELSLEEYIEGTFQQEWTKIENTIYSSKQTQKQKGDSVRFTERLVQLGYTTTSQLDVDRVAEQSAINTVQSSLLEQLVLLKYTSEKKITELISSIETARANVDSKNYTNLLDKNRLDYYRKQFENCTIKAPQDGQVVYANQDNRRFASESEMIKEGASVRERQVLIRLPDPTQMQVKAMINESNISSVRVGMKAIIAFDAMANRTFQGTVIKVNQYPEVVWMSSAKDYVTLIRIDGPTDDLRAGLTAEIRVIAEKIDNVLMLPIQAVVEINRKTYCLQNHDGVWNYKEVLLGPTNDKQVVILAGLEEGEVVVNGARQYKNNVEFPEANTPSQFEEEKKKLNPDKPETAQSDKTKSDKNAARTPEKIPGSQAADTAAGPGKGMPGGFPGANSGARPEGGQGMPGGFPGANSGAKPEGGQGMPGGFPGANSGSRPEGGQGMSGTHRRQGSDRTSGDRTSGDRTSGDRTSGDRTSGDGAMGTGRPSDEALARVRKGSKTGGSRKGMIDLASGATEKAQQEEAMETAKIQEKVQRIKKFKKYFDLTAMELCRKLDTNGDKKIDRAEVQKGAPEMSEFYDEWDRNKDGILSQTDLVIGFCTCRNLYRKVVLVEEKAAEDNEPQSKLQEFMSRDPQELFTELDKNKDGSITSDELLGAKDAEILKRFLNRLDSDRDEKVSKDEFVRGITNMKSRMKSGYRRN